ncbi:hypothetical protein [uncultured Cohaesibacter sp.]|uniref:hypothetical protein n=1 Tax=uncultured Cohaesibacter sp. TaxID=1002546 RepID=UPI00292F7FB9|nr:hypothetical protein [uncultured Cohaesibacter sp.]
MIRTILLICAALTTAAIIHIGTIFSLPYFAKNDIWHKVLELAPLNRVYVISSPTEAVKVSADLDPAFAFGLCRVDVSAAPMLMKGTFANDFWSLDYVDQMGRSQFSLTNQISGPKLNAVLATKGQQRLLSERPDLIDETTIVITATDSKGILLVRAFIASERDRPPTARSLDRVLCKPLWDDADTE